MRENNILLAEFMDWEIHPNFPYKMQRTGIEQGFRKLSDFINIDNLDYDSNWNSLMEVVERINTIKIGADEFVVIIGYNYTEIPSCHCDEIDINIEVSENATIINTYKACVEFAKWYKNYESTTS